jgi:outer membrane immunogenic protein
MKTLTYAVGTFLALIGASVASAADLGGSYKDQSPSAYSGDNGDAFRGFYFGLQGGWGSYNHDNSVNYNSTEVANYSAAGAGGGMFGVDAGYNFRMNRVVVSPFVEYGWTNHSTDLSVLEATASLTHNDEWSVGGRLGYLVNNTTLVYGLLAFTEIDASFKSNVAVTGLNTNVSWDGYTIGLGFESVFARTSAGDFSYKLEGRHAQFGKQTTLVDGSLSATSEPNSYAVVVGVNYAPRFGGVDSLK